jgi:hypothetical protein
MALLWFDGFEAGAANFSIASTKYESTVGWGGAANLASNSYPARSGSGILRYFNGQAGALSKTVTVSGATIMGAGVFKATGAWSNSPRLFQMREFSTIHLTLVIDPTLYLKLYLGDLGGTLLATSSAPITENAAYQFIEMKATVATTTGNVVVRIDDTEVINFTGTTTMGGSSIVNRAVLGPTAAFASTGAGDLRIDDFYVADTSGTVCNNFIGSGFAVRLLTVDGAGDSTAWTPSAGANWQCVDEAPPDSLDYVSTLTSGARDLYNLAARPAGTYDVLGVQTVVTAKKDDVGARLIRSVLKSGTTVLVEPTDQALTTSYKSYCYTLTKDPATNASWLPAALDGLQIGQEMV